MSDVRAGLQMSPLELFVVSLQIKPRLKLIHIHEETVSEG